jgi:hypothetical protein
MYVYKCVYFNEHIYIHSTLGFTSANINSHTYLCIEKQERQLLKDIRNKTNDNDKKVINKNKKIQAKKDRILKINENEKNKNSKKISSSVIDIGDTDSDDDGGDAFEDNSTFLNKDAKKRKLNVDINGKENNNNTSNILSDNTHNNYDNNHNLHSNIDNNDYDNDKNIHKDDDNHGNTNCENTTNKYSDFIKKKNENSTSNKTNVEPKKCDENSTINTRKPGYADIRGDIENERMDAVDEYEKVDLMYTYVYVYMLNAFMLDVYVRVYVHFCLCINVWM